MDIKKALIDFGVDYDETLTRFLDDDAFYQEFLVKFTEDTYTEDLKKALEASNVKEAFDLAHTLKGLCSNFGFLPLNKYMQPLVEILRNGSMDGAWELFNRYLEKYEQVCEIIRNSL